MAICKLCGHDRPLIRAHVFPDWAYRYLKQDNHLFQITSSLDSRKIQSGYWDDTILCRQCDGNVLGKYDTYAAEFFGQDFSTMLTAFDEDVRKEYLFYQVKNFDYSKLFIFIISLLWRASITHIAAFEKVALGRYENLAKEIILSGTPMYNDLFEVVIFAARPPTSGEKYEKSILHPFPTRFDGVNCYRFTLADFEFVVKVDKRKSDLHVSGITLQPKNLNIPLMPFEVGIVGKFVLGFKKKLWAQHVQ